MPNMILGRATEFNRTAIDTATSECQRVGAGGEQEGRGLGVSGRLTRSGVYFPERFTDAAGG
ncbi:MAG: hypothetical protein WAO35_26940, partial [Terriglobia bacterium]